MDNIESHVDAAFQVAISKYSTNISAVQIKAKNAQDNFTNAAKIYNNRIDEIRGQLQNNMITVDQFRNAESLALENLEHARIVHAEAQTKNNNDIKAITNLYNYEITTINAIHDAAKIAIGATKISSEADIEAATKTSTEAANRAMELYNDLLEKNGDDDITKNIVVVKNAAINAQKIAAQREKDAAAQREKDAAAQREKDAAAQREKDAAAQREKDATDKLIISDARESIVKFSKNVLTYIGCQIL
jgi:hypothetical protein